MRIRTALCAAAVFVAMAPAPAAAGVYTDELSKCLVASATSDDKTNMMRWLFASVTLHPEVQSMATLTPVQREELNVKATRIVTRLLTADCRRQMVAALKNEGPSSVEKAFETLGEVAMEGLMAHPAVEAGMEAFARNLDRAQLESVFREGGVTLDEAGKN